MQHVFVEIMTFEPSCSASQVLEELKRLVHYYREEMGHNMELLGLALSARKNLCIHPEVSMFR